MAISISQVGRVMPILGGGLRGEAQKAFVISPDASKPAGGYTILASALGFTYLDFGQVHTPNALYAVKLEIGTASTDATLQFYEAQATGASVGTAIGASVTGVSTKPVQALVIGRV